MLIREDGRFLYTLPSVVDDADFAVSHILRGEDHVTNTAPQIEIFEALGVPVPRFAHFALFVAAGGEVLSKREGSLSLRTLREEGIEAMALNAYLAHIGTSDSIEPALSLEALARRLRVREDGPRAGAFRSERIDGAERQDLARDAV